MDYSVINAAIDDIVYIVNDYNKTRGYSVSLCERLVIALLGYYIFNKYSSYIPDKRILLFV